jgi:hypothetical protein
MCTLIVFFNFDLLVKLWLLSFCVVLWAILFMFVHTHFVN